MMMIKKLLMCYMVLWYWWRCTCERVNTSLKCDLPSRTLRRIDVYTATSTTLGRRRMDANNDVVYVMGLFD